MGINWPQLATEQIVRPNNAAMWASVAPGVSVNLGDYGYIDNYVFTFLGNLGTSPSVAPVVQDDTPARWTSASSNSRQINEKASGEGAYWDPETETFTSAGISQGWQFTAEQAYAASLERVYTMQYADADKVMTDAMLQVWAAAGRHGYLGNDGSISPGFVVITAVAQVSACVMAASSSSSSTATLVGSVDAITDMFAGNANGGFSETKTEGGTWLFSVPVNSIDTSTKPPTNVSSDTARQTIAYRAVSYNGNSNTFIDPYVG